MFIHRYQVGSHQSEWAPLNTSVECQLKFKASRSLMNSNIECLKLCWQDNIQKTPPHLSQNSHFNLPLTYSYSDFKLSSSFGGLFVLLGF